MTYGQGDNEENERKPPRHVRLLFYAIPGQIDKLIIQ